MEAAPTVTFPLTRYVEPLEIVLLSQSVDISTALRNLKDKDGNPTPINPFEVDITRLERRAFPLRLKANELTTQAGALTEAMERELTPIITSRNQAMEGEIAAEEARIQMQIDPLTTQVSSLTAGHTIAAALEAKEATIATLEEERRLKTEIANTFISDTRQTNQDQADALGSVLNNWRHCDITSLPEGDVRDTIVWLRDDYLPTHQRLEADRQRLIEQRGVEARSAAEIQTEIDRLSEQIGVLRAQKDGVRPNLEAGLDDQLRVPAEIQREGRAVTINPFEERARYQAAIAAINAEVEVLARSTAEIDQVIGQLIEGVVAERRAARKQEEDAALAAAREAYDAASTAYAEAVANGAEDTAPPRLNFKKADYTFDPAPVEAGIRELRAGVVQEEEERIKAHAKFEAAVADGQRHAVLLDASKARQAANARKEQEAAAQEPALAAQRDAAYEDLALRKHRAKARQVARSLLTSPAMRALQSVLAAPQEATFVSLVALRGIQENNPYPELTTSMLNKLLVTCRNEQLGILGSRSPALTFARRSCNILRAIANAEGERKAVAEEILALL
jgi:hypothetical protein